VTTLAEAGGVLQTTVLEVFCCTCNFLIAKVSRPPGRNPRVVENNGDCKCKNPRLKYRINQKNDTVVEEDTHYKDADCAIKQAEWDSLTPEQRELVLHRYRFIFIDETKKPVPECERSYSVYLLCRVFDNVPQMLSGGCYVDRKCKEVAIRCATCQKRLEFEVMLMAKSKKREVDLKSKRDVLRGIKPPEEKPQEVVIGEKEIPESLVNYGGEGLSPSTFPSPIRKPITIKQWLAVREQELRRMAKKMKKQKAHKTSKKAAKKLGKKMKKPVAKGKKAKKQGKHKHHDEEE
jgi:hypothetical protein